MLCLYVVFQCFSQYFTILWYHLDQLEAFLGFEFADLCFGGILTEFLVAAKDAASHAHADQAAAVSSVEP